MNLAQKIKEELKSKEKEKNKEAREKLLKEVEARFMTGKYVIIARDRRTTMYFNGVQIDFIPYYEGCIEDLREEGFSIQQCQISSSALTSNLDRFFNIHGAMIDYAYVVKLPPDEQ